MIKLTEISGGDENKPILVNIKVAETIKEVERNGTKGTLIQFDRNAILVRETLEQIEILINQL